MASSIFSRNNNGFGNDPLSMMAEFKRFAEGMTPERAKSKIDEMLKSGQITQAQLDEATRQANDLSTLFGFK